MTNKIHWDFPNPHTIDITVDKHDLDEFEHVNNARYVQWCEMCAWSHSKSLGLTLDEYQRLNRAMVVKTAYFDYIAPAVMGQSLQLSTWISFNDNKWCLERTYQLIRLSDAKTILRGHTQFVCVELSTGKPRRMPKEFITGYGNVCLDSQPPFFT